MPVLHVFNASHDYALASFSPYYTPPARVAALERKLARVPEIWAEEHDIIYSGEAELHDPELITEVRPWGWNPQIKHTLQILGIKAELLPTDETLKKIRELSHRRLTIEFNSRILELHITDAESVPLEFTSADEAMKFYHQHPDCYFKAPWSSSGRGIIRSSDLQEKHIRPWLNGIIRRQKSVLAEIEIDRSADFASLWVSRPEGVRFIGWSAFKVSGRGKYHGNFVAHQSDLKKHIQRSVKRDIDEIIQAQTTVLDKLIAPYYQGPLGIDMASDKNGNIRPCLEINLRNTMGHAAIAYSRKLMGVNNDPESISVKDRSFSWKPDRFSLFLPLE